jgi:hypothetical protein
METGARGREVERRGGPWARLLVAAIPGAAALLALAGALFVGLGCEDTNLGCYRDLEREACRSRCRAGEEQACGALEHIEAWAGNVAALERLCRSGDMSMCIDLAQREPDPTQKRRILEEACARGDRGAPACAFLADLTVDVTEKRRLLERTCASPLGILACRRLAELDEDPAVRARRLAAVCVGGLEEACARLVEVERSAASRRALVLEACQQAGSDCASHRIARALALAKAPADAPDAGGAPREERPPAR